MRDFHDGQTLKLEPWRAHAIAVIQDLRVERSGLDRVIAAGGYCSVSTGAAPEAISMLVSHDASRLAFETAACIGCGACVAACPNASASLFVAAKLAHLGQLPQGQPDHNRRAEAMIQHMAAEGFGGCSNHLECEAACPKLISADWISWMNAEAWTKFGFKFGWS